VTAARGSDPVLSSAPTSLSDLEQIVTLIFSFYPNAGPQSRGFDSAHKNHLHKIQPLSEGQGLHGQGCAMTWPQNVLATGCAEGTLHRNEGQEGPHAQAPFFFSQSHQYHPVCLASLRSPNGSKKSQLRCLFSSPQRNLGFGGCLVEVFEEAATREVNLLPCALI